MEGKKHSPKSWYGLESMFNTFTSYLIIIICWLIFIFPSVFNAQWGFLDDPHYLYVSQNLFNDKTITNAILFPDSESGRYFPVYFIIRYIIYSLWGLSPFGFYLVHSITFLLTSFLIFWLVNNLTGRNITGVLAVILCITGSSMAENIFTLGKAEPLLINLFILLILSFIKLTKARNYIFCIFSTVLVCLSFWTKETTVVLFVLAGAYLIFTYLHYKFTDDKCLVMSSVYLSLGILGGYILSRLPHLFWGGTTSKTYISYPITSELIISNVKFYIVQQPDVLLIGFAVSLWLINELLKVFRNKTSQDIKGIYLISSIVIMGWAYIVGLLIWRWPMGYYLFVPSILFNMVLAIALIDFIRDNSKQKLLLTVIMGVLIVTKVYSLSYFYYVGTTQRSQDQIFMEAINLYNNLGQPGQRLLVENWEFYTEQVTNSNIFINELYGKSDLKVDGIKDLVESREIPNEILNLYGVQNPPNNNTRWPRKGDFVLLLTGDKLAHWSLRGIAPFKNDFSMLQKLGFDLQLLSAKEIFHKSLIYDRSSSNVLFKDTFLGYKLYQVKKPVPRLNWEGRYSDGWIGKSSKLTINPQEQKVLNFEVFTALSGKKNSLKIFSDGKIIKEIKGISNRKMNFQLIVPEELMQNSTLEFTFLVENVFIPLELGNSNDSRELGLLINIIDSDK